MLTSVLPLRTSPSWATSRSRTCWTSSTSAQTGSRTLASGARRRPTSAGTTSTTTTGTTTTMTTWEARAREGIGRRRSTRNSRSELHPSLPAISAQSRRYHTDMSACLQPTGPLPPSCSHLERQGLPRWSRLSQQEPTLRYSYPTCQTSRSSSAHPIPFIPLPSTLSLPAAHPSKGRAPTVLGVLLLPLPPACASLASETSLRLGALSRVPKGKGARLC
jgi:hypothetical protein